MDHDLIYAKTASGEGAMLQRTRVMQRNVRMVLILVDSQSTVGDLCLKTGNPQLTENALRELEEGGFIEPRVEPDSLWEEGEKVAREIRAAAGNKRIQIAPRRSGNSNEPSAIPTSTPSSIKEPETSDWSISEFSLASPHPERSPVTLAPLAAEDGSKESIGQIGPVDSAPSFAGRIWRLFSKPSWRKNKATFADSPGSVPPGEHKGGLETVERPKAPAPKASEAVVLKTPVRRRGASMGWPLAVILSIAGALALGFLTVLLFPYNTYLPGLELAFSNAIGRPVKLGNLSVDLYPKPALLLGDIRIANDKDEIRIDEIRLQPVLGTLTAKKKVFREVLVSGTSLSAETIASLPGFFVALSNPAARTGVTSLGFEKVSVSFAGLGFSGMNGEAKLSSDGQFQSLMLRSADRSLTLSATPRVQGLDVVVEGFGWRPSPASLFVFDSVNLKGELEGGMFSIKNMELRIFDGLVVGAAVLRADKKPSIAGDVSFKRVNATRFGDALGLGQQFSGETAGEIRFSTSADSWESIFSTIDADGEFSMHRGSIRGIDLTEAARSVSKNPTQGGATQFESLSGTVRLTPTNYQFSGLVLNSGLMQSTGTIDVSKELKVSGKIELKIRGTVNQTRVPLVIGGPLQSPTVLLGRGE
jgi:hypothetical protein